MSKRYRLFRRNEIYYLHDGQTGKQESLRTKDVEEAKRVIHAHQEATVQPSINLIIARAYLHASDPAYVTRTWGNVLDAIIALKKGDTKYRWETVAKDRALAPLKKRIVTNTPGQLFLDAMQAGTVSTNVYLRRIHNFALDMNWLLNPVIAKRAWPKVVYGDNRRHEDGTQGGTLWSFRPNVACWTGAKNFPAAPDDASRAFTDNASLWSK